MRSRRPSFTARSVALIRSRLPRPKTPEGDSDAERQLYDGLRLQFGLPLFAGRGRISIAERTAFIDEETLLAITNGIAQVIIVGAGYDGRALRFRTRGVRFFEVDHPATQVDKRRRLDRLGVSITHVRFVPINLISERLEDVLSKTDFRREDASLFLCEGLVRYLPKPCVRHLFSDLRALAAPGSKLVLNNREYLAPIGLSRRRIFLSLLREPICSTFTIGETARLLNSAGWQITREVRRAVVKSERILVAAEPVR
jgi:methyltransferase (TIGR00027 family)